MSDIDNGDECKYEEFDPEHYGWKKKDKQLPEDKVKKVKTRASKEKDKDDAGEGENTGISKESQILTSKGNMKHIKFGADSSDRKLGVSHTEDLHVDVQNECEKLEDRKQDIDTGNDCGIESVTKYPIVKSDEDEEKGEDVKSDEKDKSVKSAKRSPKFSDKITYTLEIRYSNGYLLENKTRKQHKNFIFDSQEEYKYLKN